MVVITLNQQYKVVCVAPRKCKRLAVFAELDISIIIIIAANIYLFPVPCEFSPPTALKHSFLLVRALPVASDRNFNSKCFENKEGFGDSFPVVGPDPGTPTMLPGLGIFSFSELNFPLSWLHFQADSLDLHQFQGCMLHTLDLAARVFLFLIPPSRTKYRSHNLDFFGVHS